MRLRRTVAIAFIVLTATGAIASSSASAAGRVSIRIEKHARPSSQGGLSFTVHVRCGPLPGLEDFREGFAGAAQLRTGAEAEGGLSPGLVCDGVERVYTARLSPFTEEGFARGPAVAGVSIVACNVMGDEQICVSGSAGRTIVISGPRLA